MLIEKEIYLTTRMLATSLLAIIFIARSVSGVQVEFEVTVPRYYTPLLDDLYIAGTFNNWLTDNQNYKLTRKSFSENVYKLTVNLPPGNHQFKITRGDWDTTETLADGSFMPNRALNVNNQQQQQQQLAKITVQSWNDIKRGRNTAAGNVYVLKSKFNYPQFNTTKKVWIYLPNDYFYTPTKTYPVVYMHDAQNLFDSLYSFIGQEWGIDETLERFAALNLPTSILVGLENTNLRMSELTPYSHPSYGGGSADLYLEFLKNNLKPFIDSTFRTRKDRASTALVGSSLGGLTSFYAGLKHQSVFSKIGVFSPSFWYSEKIYAFASGAIREYSDSKFYFLCGAKESESMVGDMVKMVEILKQKGFATQTVVKQDGQHSEWFWNREFPSAYEYLFYF